LGWIQPSSPTRQLPSRYPPINLDNLQVKDNCAYAYTTISQALPTVQNVAPIKRAFISGFDGTATENGMQVALTGANL